MSATAQIEIQSLRRGLVGILASVGRMTIRKKVFVHHSLHGSLLFGYEAGYNNAKSDANARAAYEHLPKINHLLSALRSLLCWSS